MYKNTWKNVICFIKNKNGGAYKAMEYATKVLHMGGDMLFFGSKEDYLKSELSKSFCGLYGRNGNE